MTQRSGCCIPFSLGRFMCIILYHNHGAEIIKAKNRDEKNGESDDGLQAKSMHSPSNMKSVW